MAAAERQRAQPLPGHAGELTCYGAVNIEETANAGPKAGFTENGIPDRAAIVHQARLMAYRREPAMVELAETR